LAPSVPRDDARHDRITGLAGSGQAGKISVHVPHFDSALSSLENARTQTAVSAGWRMTTVCEAIRGPEFRASPSVRSLASSKIQEPREPGDRLRERIVGDREGDRARPALEHRVAINFRAMRKGGIVSGRDAISRRPRDFRLCVFLLLPDKIRLRIRAHCFDSRASPRACSSHLRARASRSLSSGRKNCSGCCCSSFGNCLITIISKPLSRARFD
jgi:hypothetical protein